MLLVIQKSNEEKGSFRNHLYFGLCAFFFFFFPGHAHLLLQHLQQNPETIETKGSIGMKSDVFRG